MLFQWKFCIINLYIIFSYAKIYREKLSTCGIEQVLFMCQSMNTVFDSGFFPFWLKICLSFFDQHRNCASTLKFVPASNINTYSKYIYWVGIPILRGKRKFRNFLFFISILNPLYFSFSSIDALYLSEICIFKRCTFMGLLYPAIHV